MIWLIVSILIPYCILILLFLSSFGIFRSKNNSNPSYNFEIVYDSASAIAIIKSNSVDIGWFDVKQNVFLEGSSTVLGNDTIKNIITLMRNL